MSAPEIVVTLRIRPGDPGHAEAIRETLSQSDFPLYGQGDLLALEVREVDATPVVVVIEVPDAAPDVYCENGVAVIEVSAYPTSHYCSSEELDGYPADLYLSIAERLPGGHPALPALAELHAEFLNRRLEEGL